MRITNHCLTMVKESSNSVEFIYCYCGCGKTRPKYQIEYGRVRKDRPRLYIKGHDKIEKFKGRIISEETRKKISETMKTKFTDPKFSQDFRIRISNALTEKCTGEKHWRWSGNNPSYRALHRRIRKQIPKPDLCELCLKSQSIDLANISGEYLLDLDDWLYLCKDCHKFFDRQMFMSRI